MPVTFYRTFLRPSTEVEFPEDSAEFTQFVLDTYVSTNECLEHRTATYSADNLIKTTKSVWKDQATFDTALSNPIWQENIDFISSYTALNNILIYYWVE